MPHLYMKYFSTIVIKKRMRTQWSSFFFIRYKTDYLRVTFTTAVRPSVVVKRTRYIPGA